MTWATQWYVVDKRSGRIVNAVLTAKPDGPNLSTFIDAEHLTATTTPTQSQLEGYRYYWERP
jgi:hypothetical protein